MTDPKPRPSGLLSRRAPSDATNTRTGPRTPRVNGLLAQVPRAAADATFALPQEGAVHDRTFDPQDIAAPTSLPYRLAGSVSRGLSSPAAMAARLTPGMGDVLDAGASIVEAGANILRGAPASKEIGLSAVGMLPFVSGAMAREGEHGLETLLRHADAPSSGTLHQTIADRARFLRDIGDHRAADELLHFAGDNQILVTPVVHGTANFTDDAVDLSKTKDIGFHVGTPEQAAARAKIVATYRGGTSPQMLPLVMREGENPLLTNDLGTWDTRSWREEAARIGSDIRPPLAEDLARLDNLARKGALTDEGRSIREALQRHDITSIIYRNAIEGEQGKVSAIAIDPASVKGLMSRRFTRGKSGLFTGLLAALGGGAASSDESQPTGLLGRR